MLPVACGIHSGRETGTETVRSLALFLGARLLVFAALREADGVLARPSE